MARTICAALACVVLRIVPAGAEPPASPPWIGDEAPPLTVESIVDPVGRLPIAGPIVIDRLRGKVVVVEFSTSWCAGCVLAVPHMNALAAEFAGDESVVFLTLTNESEAAAAAFREKSGIKTPFGRDEDGSTFEDYWVNAIPGAAVIGPDGRIAALLHPEHLTAQVIRDAKAGRRVEAADWARERIRRNWDTRWLDPKAGEPAAIGVRVTKTEKAGGQSRMDPKTGELRASGLPAATLIGVALGVSPRNVEFKGTPPDGYYDLTAVPPDGSLDTVRELARRSIEQELGVSIEKVRSKQPGYVLRRLPGAAPLPPAESRPGSARPGAIDLPKTTMANLSKLLGNFTDKPIGDATGLTGEHRVSMTWDAQGGGEALKAALRTAGFELSAGDVEVERVMVSPRS